MNRKEKVFLVFLSVTMVGLGQGCSPGCKECDPSGSICFACDANMEADIFGVCQ